MQILVDLASHIAGTPTVVQVDRAPVSAAGIPINGKFLLPTLPGLDFPVDSSSYVLPIDGGDLTSQSYAHLLASYAGMFDFIYFNPLLDATNVGEIDLAATFKDSEPPYDPPNLPQYFPTRLQIGRPGGGPISGQMPTHTAVLPMNDTITPNNPGVMVTDNIDISAYTGAAGADEFMIYWQIYSFAVGDDVATDQGSTVNTPAIRTYSEADQEPADFSVYLSPDDGSHWCPVGMMEPIAFWAKTTAFRLAFVNRRTVATYGAAAKVYVASFAVLF